MGWSVNRATGLTHHRPTLSTKGYTLLTPHGGDTTHLIDIEGRVVQQWKFEHIKPGYGRLLSNGNLLMTGSDADLKPPPNHDDPRTPAPPFEERVRMLGGYHTTLCEVNWQGEVIWEYVNPFQHHDFYRFDTGNTLVPVWVELPDDMRKRVRGGLRRPREKLPPLIGDELIEIDAAGQEVRRIDVWQLLDPVKDPIFPSIRRWEWTHVNGIDVNEAGEIVFSARHVNRLGIIDSAGTLTWKFDQTHHQHQPTWVPGEGPDATPNVLIFDNGQSVSRVVEIDPRSSEIVWTYRGKPAYQFFSAHISGAVQLASRNVLICEGTSGRLFEVTRAGEVVWEWINPFLNTDAKGEPAVSIYRAHRYAPDHPGLAGRTLDPAAFGNLNRLHGLM